MTEEIESLNFIDKKYNENHFLSKCDNVILKAKRVIIDKELDSGYTLSKSHLPNKPLDSLSRDSKRHLNLREDSFWNQYIPCPGKPSIENNFSNIINANEEHINLIINADLQTGLEHLAPNSKSDCSLHGFVNDLLRKHFKLWKDAIYKRKSRREFLEVRIEQKANLERFVGKLKNQSIEKMDKQQHEHVNRAVTPNTPKIYINRFKAQKAIIDMQKSKLEEQNKLIEELKLGIIREDLEKSIENTKINIRELISSCSQKVKMLAPVATIEVPNLSLNSIKAPKFVQDMEERAMQRAQKHKVIQERKKLIEAARQKMLEEAIERKRVLAEEDRKRNLEAIKERRKRELDIERVRQMNKQRYYEKLNKAIRLHKMLVLRKSFKELYKNFLYFKQKNMSIAVDHCKNSILRKSVQAWIDYIGILYKPKYDIAEAYFTYTVLRNSFETWKWMYIEGKRDMQVAEDYYDFRLTSNLLIHWNRYVCASILLETSRMCIAQGHYERKIILQYFYQWMSLKTVLQLERTNELKKRRWREKVWEILPDFKPPDDF